MSSPLSPLASAIKPAGAGTRGHDFAAEFLRLALPGWNQLRWGQTDRGIVYMGSCLSSLAAAILCWGSLLGWMFLALSALWQMISIGDGLRQIAFPVFPGRIAACSVVVATGLLVHLPILSILLTYAWPTEADRINGVAYLVNRRAYQSRAPVPGQWVWVRSSPSRTPRSGLVVAVAGQEVECTGRGWRVDGRDVALPFPGPETDYSDGWRFRVPADHVLIGPECRGAKEAAPSPLVIVARDQIVGRAWARYYPLWERSLL